MESNLKLVMILDKTNNTFSVREHNLTPEGAQQLFAELQNKLICAVTVDQQTRHEAIDAQSCLECRSEVERANIASKPTYERRKET